MVPEKISKHIAKRLRNFSIVLDVDCGVGSSTVAFAKEKIITIGKFGG